MTEIEHNEFTEHRSEEFASTDQLAKQPLPKPTIGGTAKLLIGILLVLGLSTAAVAVTAPQMLEPIANAIPDSLFPQNDASDIKSFSKGSC